MDKLGDMDLFVRVVKNGGLAVAGREVGLSPASMSARINALEQRYGLRLLNRTTRHVSPTEAGRKFYDACLCILADVGEAEAQLQSVKESYSGPLRITATSDMGQQHIAPLLSKFIVQHPDIKPHLYLTDGIVNLAEQSFDLGIRYGHLPDSSMIVRKLAASHRVVCASPNYLKTKGIPQTPQALTEHDCLVMVRVTEPLTNWYFQTPNGQQTVAINAARSSNDGALIRKWALEGAGIALKSYLDVAADLKAKRLVTVLDDFMQDFNKQSTLGGSDLQLVYPSRQYMPQRVQGFIDVLVEHFQLLGKTIESGTIM
ncbi:MAG: LysR family transcriptional regulator [Methylococcales bacterium]